MASNTGKHWATRGIALVFACGGVAYALLLPSVPNALIMGSMLLLGWNMAFTPAPAREVSMRDVYREALGGTFRTSLTAKLVTVASVLLFIAGLAGNLTQ